MKIVSAQEMSNVEKKAFEEGCSEKDFMVNAGSNVGAIVEKLAKEKQILLLVGKGNNGGDAYVAGIYLLKKAFSVTAFHLAKKEESSPLNQKYLEEFLNAGGKVEHILKPEAIAFPKKALILDALLGTGFKGALEGLYLDAVKKANESNLPIFSIDIPTGLNGTNGQVLTDAIKADVTIFLGLPKKGFFLNEGPNQVGKLMHADFGLPAKYEQMAHPFANYFQKNDVCLAKVIKKRHKYQKGYVLGVAGSKGMEGAAKLSALAALKSGCGIIRLFSLDPTLEMSFIPYEIIHQTIEENDLSTFFEQCKRAAAIFMGPGMGRDKHKGEIFFKILEKINLPCVLDADALFHISEKKDVVFPKDVILTPHRGEMLRLLQIEDVEDEKFLEHCAVYAKEKKVILVVKGAPTFIFHHEKTPYVISSGSPALATAGTGDVLTGIIAAQLSEGIDPYQAAAQGGYLHGRAGEIAEKEKSSYSVIASDVVDCLPKVFKELMKSN